MPSTSYIGRHSASYNSYSSYPSSYSGPSSFYSRSSVDRPLYSGSSKSNLYSGSYSSRLSSFPSSSSYSSISDIYRSSRISRLSPPRYSLGISSNNILDRDATSYSSIKYREPSRSKDSGYSSRYTSRDRSYDYTNSTDIGRRNSGFKRTADEDSGEDKSRVSDRIRVFESKKDPTEERLAQRRQRLGLSPTRESKSRSPKFYSKTDNNKRPNEENGNNYKDQELPSISDLCKTYDANLNLSNGIQNLDEVTGCSGGSASISLRGLTDGLEPEISEETLSKDSSSISINSKSPVVNGTQLVDPETTSNRLGDSIWGPSRQKDSPSLDRAPLRNKDRREIVKERIARRLASELEDGDSPPIRRRSPTGDSSDNFSESKGLVGLRNIGNTCFLNSITQCLSNTRCLMEYLVREGYSSDVNVTLSTMKGDLVKAFAGLLSDMWREGTSDGHSPLNTGSFKSQIQRFAPVFIGYAQHDAQEFLRKLLEGLHEDVNRVILRPRAITEDIDETLDDNQKAMEAWKRYLRYDDSKIVDMFVGQLKSSLHCSVCGHRSVTFDPFWDLSLPIPSRSGQVRLSQCLDLFTKEEVLDGDERPTCSKCKERRRMTKTFSIQKFPKVLVLHLKRFSPHERWRGKLTCMVDFLLEGLDLSNYASNTNISCRYRLMGVANHSGTALSGHYTAYCRHPYLNSWHEYNDSRVSSMSPHRVCSPEAYVLFYELTSY